MTDTIEKLKTTDPITTFYTRLERHADSNILEFVPPMSRNGLEILDNVEGFLEDLQTRAIAEDILSKAIFDIAAKVANNS